MHMKFDLFLLFNQLANSAIQDAKMPVSACYLRVYCSLKSMDKLEGWIGRKPEKQIKEKFKAFKLEIGAWKELKISLVITPYS